jgi:hypothetical protein
LRKIIPPCKTAVPGATSGTYKKPFTRRYDQEALNAICSDQVFFINPTHAHINYARRIQQQSRESRCSPDFRFGLPSDKQD